MGIKGGGHSALLTRSIMCLRRNFSFTADLLKTRKDAHCATKKRSGVICDLRFLYFYYVFFYLRFAVLLINCV